MKGSTAPQRVMLAVPTLSWRMNTQLTSFLLEVAAGKYLDPQHWRFEFVFLPETSPVHYARNVLVGALLAGSCDWLWFLDDDMTPSEATCRIFEVEGDVISGRAPIVRPDEEGEPRIAHAAFSSRHGDEFLYAPMGSGPQPIVAAGAGCLLIRREVLADARMRVGDRYESAFGDPRSLSEEPDAAPAVFRMPSKPNGEPLTGEDVDFVYRAHVLGYRCVFESAARLGHYKMVDLSGLERMISRAVARAKAGT